MSLSQLPLEIMLGIIHYIDIPDILQMRQVSRYLNKVSRNRDVWADVYRRAMFVCPPGPFPSQSVHDLEKALVLSFRLDRNLCHGGSSSQKERPTLKLRDIRYTGVALRVNLIFGRFLFIAFKEEVRCYDLNLDIFDSNSGASIVYRSTGKAIRSFRCVSAVDAEGRPFACAVLSEALDAVPQLSIFLLNVGEESEVTLDLLCQLEYSVVDIDSVNLSPRTVVVQGHGPDPSGRSHWHIVTLDIHTRLQFLLSSFVHAKWGKTAELPEWRTLKEITSPTSILTSTHLLLALSFYTQAEGWTTFLQAFALPPPNIHRQSSALLNPSHSGSIHGVNLLETILLRDAVLDPTTQDILIAVLVHAYEPSRPRSAISKHGTLRLSTVPKSHNHDAEVGTITFQPLGFLGQYRTPFLHSSLNGTGRVFYTVEPGSCVISALEYDLRDTGGHEYEPRIVEYPSILRFPTPRVLLDYDPYSGRLCLRSSMARYSVIEILDLAV